MVLHCLVPCQIPKSLEPQDVLQSADNFRIGQFLEMPIFVSNVCQLLHQTFDRCYHPIFASCLGLRQYQNLILNLKPLLNIAKSDFDHESFTEFTYKKYLPNTLTVIISSALIH